MKELCEKFAQPSAQSDITDQKNSSVSSNLLAQLGGLCVGLPALSGDSPDYTQRHQNRVYGITRVRPEIINLSRASIYYKNNCRHQQ